MSTPPPPPPSSLSFTFGNTIDFNLHVNHSNYFVTRHTALTTSSLLPFVFVCFHLFKNILFQSCCWSILLSVILRTWKKIVIEKTQFSQSELKHLNSDALKQKSSSTKTGPQKWKKVHSPHNCTCPNIIIKKIDLILLTVIFQNQ